MKVVIISNNDWDGLWYQRQQFASMYARAGHEVLFINKTLQRYPIVKDFKDRFFRKNAHSQLKRNSIPSGVRVVSIYTLPPVPLFRYANKLMIKRSLTNSGFKYCDLLITYVPSYTSQDIIEYLKPSKSAYINVHNYDDDEVVKSLLQSEKQLCSKIDYLFADSQFNHDRLVRISNGREVNFSEPGVNSLLFASAYRGDETQKRLTIGYFGGIGSHLNLDLYNNLSENFNVVFVGSFNRDNIRERLSDKIRLIEPVSNNELPQIMKSWDIIAILYNPTGYVHGVIPAKIYECLSTAKPIIVSGLSNLMSIKDVVYEISELSQVETVMGNIAKENAHIAALRKEIGASADWTHRFNTLNQTMEFEVYGNQ